VVMFIEETEIQQGSIAARAAGKLMLIGWEVLVCSDVLETNTSVLTIIREA